MTPAAVCETHRVIVATPRPDEATAEELEGMIGKVANHAYNKGVQGGLAIGAAALEASAAGAGLNAPSERKDTERPKGPCKIKYYPDTPPDLNP